MKHLSSRHPEDIELALLAGEDAGRIRRYSLERHVRSCGECQEKVDGFRSLRGRLADSEMPDLNWGSLAAEMRANIRLGLEAGECVRETRRFGAAIFGNRSYGLVAAFTCLLLLAGASIVMRDVRHDVNRDGSGGIAGVGVRGVIRESARSLAQISAQPGAVASGSLPSLESNNAGVVLHSGGSSFTLLNHDGAVASQTVSAQGAVRSRYVDSGTVTINNVYLE